MGWSNEFKVGMLVLFATGAAKQASVRMAAARAALDLIIMLFIIFMGTENLAETRAILHQSKMAKIADYETLRNRPALQVMRKRCPKRK